jgi:hypothetical protein
MLDTDFNKGRMAAAIISGVALWGLHFLPFLIPGARLWGFNHLLFLSPVFSYIYLVGGVFAFLLFFPPIREWFWNIYSSIADRLFGHQFRLKLFILSFVALAVFWLARVPTSLLGDGYTLIYNIGNEMPVVFKWSEIGSVRVIYLLSSILPFTGLKLGEYSYAIISVVSGAVTFSFLGLLAFELTRENAGRLLTLSMLLLAGWMMLFFGYVENYPVIWPFVTAYLYFSVRHLKGKGSLIPSTILVLIALTLHLQILFFLISYPILMFAQGPGERIYRTNKKIIWGLLIIITLIGAAVFLRRYDSSIAFRSFFVPLMARPGVPYYSLFSPSHLIDIINEYMLLIPLFPVLAIVSWKYFKRIFHDKLDAFLAAFSLGGVLFVFSIDPKLGMGCDWDLFALCGLGPLLLMSRHFVMASDKFRKLCLPMAALTLVLSFPFFSVTLGRQSSIDHFKWLLNLDVPRSRFGMTFFRQYYVDVGDQAKADSLHHEIINRFPALNLGWKITALAEEGRYREALSYADSLYALDPYSTEPYNLRGWVYLQMGQNAKAIENLEQSLQLGRYDLRIFCNLAHAYFRLPKYDKALGLFRRAQAYSPEYLPVLDGLSNCFYVLGQYDSAIVYAQKGIKQDPAYELGYEIAGTASYMKGDYSGAERYLIHFLNMTSDSEGKSRAVNLLSEMRKDR